MHDLKKVSIIIPCRNEEKFIEKVIKSIINQTYPKEKLEVIFVDGMSEDKTPDIIKLYSNKYPFIKLLKNPYKYVPHAMNIGIKNATGDIIVRMDAHAEYPDNYIETLVYWLDKLKADNVGAAAVTLPSSNSNKAKAIAFTLSHPFGVGNSLFRVIKDSKRPIEVDTVPFGCYPRKIFQKLGLYDERLIRNQDIELNKRIKKFGGKIFLLPFVKIKYYARDTWKKLWKNNFDNGKWVILTAYYTHDINSLSLRHFIPLLFVIYLILIPFGLLILNTSYLIPFFIYVFLNFLFSIKISYKEKNIKLLPYLFITFFVLHISYGVGSIIGLLSVLKMKILKEKT